MVKPLWALTGVALLGAGGIAGALVVASPGGEEEVVQQVETATATEAASATSEASPIPIPEPPTPFSSSTRTPGPGETLYRWANISVILPDAAGFFAGPSANPLHFTFVKRDPDDPNIFSQYVIHGENGAIIEKHILIEHRAEMDEVLATLIVGSFDPTSAPWPYNGEPSDERTREIEGGISFIRPSPATGTYVGGGVRDPGGFFITLSNGRSTAFVGTNTEGAYSKDTSAVLDDDMPVFERWLNTVKRCDIEIEC